MYFTTEVVIYTYTYTCTGTGTGTVYVIMVSGETRWRGGNCVCRVVLCCEKADGGTCFSCEFYSMTDSSRSY